MPARRLRDAEVPSVISPRIRHQGQPGEHAAMFLSDFSGKQSSSKASSIPTIFFEVVSSSARTRIAERMRTVDHLIIGGGVISASIAYHLAVRCETTVTLTDACRGP